MTSSSIYKFEKVVHVALGVLVAASLVLFTVNEAEAQTRSTSKSKVSKPKRVVRPKPAASTSASGSAGAQATNEDNPKNASSPGGDSGSSNMDFGTSEYRLELNDNESRFLLTVYGQMSQFNYVGESLLGSAIEVSALYALNQDFAAGISIAQALDPSEGLAILYTGIRASGSYAIFGTFIQREAMLNVDGKTAFISTLGKGSLMAFDFGLEQLIFNGTSRIIPATGFSAGLRYDASFWGATWSLSGRYGQLIISEKMASMMTFGGGILMRF